MPMFRTMVSLPAGLFHMGRIRFLIWTTGGALIWNILLVGGGWLLGARFREIDRYLGPVSSAVIAIIVAVYVWRLVTWRPRAVR